MGGTGPWLSGLRFNASNTRNLPKLLSHVWGSNQEPFMEEVMYKLTADDFLAASRLHSTRAFRWKRAVLAFVLIVLCWSVWLWASFPELGLSAYAAVPVVVVALYCLMWLLGWYLLVLVTRRSWEQSHKMWIEQRVRFTSEAIEFHSERGDVRILWSDFYRWAADAKILLLYQTSRSYITVPLRGFEPEATIKIRNLLEAAGVPER